MNEDPTRIMRRGEDPRGRRRAPEPQRPHGNVRLVIALMGAVIVGLFIALLVTSGSGGTETVTITTEMEATTPEETARPSEEKEKTTPAEKEEKEAEGAETPEEETGGIEGAEPEVTPEEEAPGTIEEALPEEEGGLTPEGTEEGGGGGVGVP